MNHLEFFGLPGSGKSTMKYHIINELKRKKNNVFSDEDALLHLLKDKNEIFYFHFLKYIPSKYSEKLLKSIFNRSKLKFASINRFLAIHGNLVQAIFKSDKFDKVQIQEKEKILSWFFNTISIYQIIEDDMQNNVTIVFDEGFIHKIINLFISPSQNYNNNYNEDIINYIKYIPKPDYLFIVDSKIDDCFERMKIRGFPTRLKTKSEEEIKDYLRICQGKIDFIIDYLKEKKYDIIRISNNNSLEVVINSLPELIKQI